MKDRNDNPINPGDIVTVELQRGDFEVIRVGENFVTVSPIVEGKRANFGFGAKPSDVTVKPNNGRIEADSLAIRNALRDLVEQTGSLFEHAEVDLFNRNSFCIRLAPGTPIFTVTVNYGGSLRA